MRGARTQPETPQPQPTMDFASMEPIAQICVALVGVWQQWLTSLSLPISRRRAADLTVGLRHTLSYTLATATFRLCSDVITNGSRSMANNTATLPRHRQVGLVVLKAALNAVMAV